MNDQSFHIEQDYKWVSEQNPVTKQWMKNKQVALNTYTVYEYVGEPLYQTPVLVGVSNKEAKEYVNKIVKNHS
jgi:hypothetical protein